MSVGINVIYVQVDLHNIQPVNAEKNAMWSWPVGHNFKFEQSFMYILVLKKSSITLI